MEHIINMHEAKTQLSKLVAFAQRGESVTISCHGKPVAKLVPVPREDAQAAAERERRKAEALTFFEKGVDIGEPVPWTRDEIYLERFERKADQTE